jgi:hypothetical protein
VEWDAAVAGIIMETRTGMEKKRQRHHPINTSRIKQRDRRPKLP